MDTPRRTKRIGNESTRTGLAARMNQAREDSTTEKVVTTRGADALLAKAREAGLDAGGPDESTLSTIESLLRDV